MTWKEFGLFSHGKRDRMKGDSLKLCQRRCRLDLRENFVTECVVKAWNRLPRPVVESLSLEMFEELVDVALEDKI